MTAEIIVMNKLALAVAADSAVTIGLKRGQKIYQSANKLFALSKHAPVGIMIYGKAEFMGIPWETIVKTYRKELKEQRFDHLDSYANHLIGFIESNRILFPEEI